VGKNNVGRPSQQELRDKRTIKVIGIGFHGTLEQHGNLLGPIKYP